MASFTFVIPVKDHRGVDNWATVQRELAATADSVAGQTCADWQCVVVAQEGAPLPRLPADIEVLRLDLPPAEVPTSTRTRSDRTRRHAQIRQDKGNRVLSGLQHLSGSTYWMNLDYDDLVHRQLVERVVRDEVRPGYKLDDGYMFSSGNWAVRTPDIHLYCGSTIILHKDAVDIPDVSFETIPDIVQAWFGSHWIPRLRLEEAGTPLQSLGIPGVMYRVGSGASTSLSSGLLRKAFPASLLMSSPRHFARRVRGIKRLNRVAPDYVGASE